jgi:hypothetical protein
LSDCSFSSESNEDKLLVSTKEHKILAGTHCSSVPAATWGDRAGLNVQSWGEQAWPHSGQTSGPAGAWKGWRCWNKGMQGCRGAGMWGCGDAVPGRMLLGCWGWMGFSESSRGSSGYPSHLPRPLFPGQGLQSEVVPTQLWAVSCPVLCSLPLWSSTTPSSLLKLSWPIQARDWILEQWGLASLSLQWPLICTYSLCLWSFISFFLHQSFPIVLKCV